MERIDVIALVFPREIRCLQLPLDKVTLGVVGRDDPEILPVCVELPRNSNYNVGFSFILQISYVSFRDIW